MTNLDALAVGPHPDDVELFCGGTIARMTQLGYRVGVLDLTEGELASNGTVEQRRQEAHAAAEVLGLALRENLKLPDGGIQPGTDAAQIAAAVRALRRLRPELLLIPWLEARHPDHAAAGALMRRAVFTAGLRKYETHHEDMADHRSAAQEPFRPRILFYQLRHRFTPSFVIDVSSAIETKVRAIMCHQSQLNPGAAGKPTLVGSPEALTAIDARDRYYGSYIGVRHGEPFKSEATLGINDPIQHFRTHPFRGAHAFEALQ